MAADLILSLICSGIANFCGLACVNMGCGENFVQNVNREIYCKTCLFAVCLDSFKQCKRVLPVSLTLASFISYSG